MRERQEATGDKATSKQSSPTRARRAYCAGKAGTTMSTYGHAQHFNKSMVDMSKSSAAANTCRLSSDGMGLPHTSVPIPNTRSGENKCIREHSVRLMLDGLGRELENL